MFQKVLIYSLILLMMAGYWSIKNRKKILQTGNWFYYMNIPEIVLIKNLDNSKQKFTWIKRRLTRLVARV